ncbi:Lariat debranching enzyme [Spathaspora sp. JA1]|nr:Lariat debranching enzyme [Spathaspora sp. JA1]
MSSVKIAIQGCAHGELSKVYSKVAPDTDLVLILGDFQALRSTQDYQALNVPPKYRTLGDFHSYYDGTLTAPYLTIFIGGNHENSSYLQELKYGGWVAPRIYYLGEFGSVWYRGIQIAGWSGIFNRSTFSRNDLHFERPPYRRDELVSVYHQKLSNFIKLYMMNHDLDIVMSHDWPVGIEQYGNKSKLLSLKPYFKKDIENNDLGSPLNKFLLDYLRPRYWFSAHLHVLFEARVQFKKDVVAKEKSKNSNQDEIELNMDDDQMVSAGKVNKDEIELSMDDETSNPVVNKDEINLNMDDDETTVNANEIQLDMDEPKPEKIASPLESTLYLGKPPTAKVVPPRISPIDQNTDFLALDKCGGRRAHIRQLTVTPTESHQTHPSCKDTRLHYSKRAIAINRVVESYIKSHGDAFCGIDTRSIIADPQNLILVNELMPLVEMELKKLNELNDETFVVQDTFKAEAPTVDDGSQLKFYPNSQTEEYCKKFNIVPPNLE